MHVTPPFINGQLNNANRLSCEDGPWVTYRAVPPHSQKKTQGMLHLNNINAYHSRLKTWRGRFRGVACRTLAKMTSAGTDGSMPPVKH